MDVGNERKKKKGGTGVAFEGKARIVTALLTVHPLSLLTLRPPILPRHPAPFTPPDPSLAPMPSNPHSHPHGANYTFAHMHPSTLMVNFLTYHPHRPYCSSASPARVARGGISLGSLHRTSSIGRWDSSVMSELLPNPFLLALRSSQYLSPPNAHPDPIYDQIDKALVFPRYRTNRNGTGPRTHAIQHLNSNIDSLGLTSNSNEPLFGINSLTGDGGCPGVRDSDLTLRGLSDLVDLGTAFTDDCEGKRGISDSSL